ncbi:MULTISPECIES: prephenate dehydrogenase [Pelosinus]|uniref:Prephenate dehydrogenase n=1 Tax=Pelosinus fermentans B4 TaxID=1149862 RepID=I9AYL8_9FIRM|nr:MULTISPECIES: prephenate dehydrogenase/arogenate dehydrogenase family protein [Pelosinus]EIW17982.1 Prephenate dehydrogenase [Pelosinus fermentans B4]EIW23944.1 Prephenate dehydrogenase [Pelosinus fermentans A11]OAM94867.1 Prephenate dehydrogenase [Pelosinus fermentans DSM 17108]SDR19288.1 prephenate dehydrogenase [Pelosinus fermentans]
MKVKHITIIGLGLIGGSLGLALKKQCGEALKVTGVDHDQETLELAVQRGAVDYSTNDWKRGVEQADIIFLCTPVLQIIPIVEQILPYVKVGGILTDVGSTKGFLAEKLLYMMPSGVHYVSGHPMTGIERSGIMAADRGLFKDKWYILIPEASTSPEAVEIISQTLTWTGARITTMDLYDHDQCAAIISHIPHVVAAALVNLLGKYPALEESFKLVGGGFRDTTRIASSNADMWADICLTNSQPITQSLLQLKELLDEMIQAVEKADRPAIHHFFKRAKVRRDILIEETDSHVV